MTEQDPRIKNPQEAQAELYDGGVTEFFNEYMQGEMGDRHLRSLGDFAAHAIMGRHKTELTSLSDKLNTYYQRENTSENYDTNQGRIEGLLGVLNLASTDERMDQKGRLPLPRPKYPKRVKEIKANLNKIKQDVVLTDGITAILAKNAVDVLMDEDRESEAILSRGFKDLYLKGLQKNSASLKRDEGRVEGMLEILAQGRRWIAPDLSQRELTELSTSVEASKVNIFGKIIKIEDLPTDQEGPYYPDEIRFLQKSGLLIVRQISREEVYYEPTGRGKSTLSRYQLPTDLNNE